MSRPHDPLPPVGLPGPVTLERVSGGDPTVLRQLRANLAAFARASDDPDTKDLVSDVLAGRRPLTEVLADEEFNRVGQQHLDNLLQGIDELEPDQREEVLAVRTLREPGDDRPQLTADTDLAALRDAATPADGWASEDAARPEDRRRPFA